MKYIIGLFFIASVGGIITGFFLKPEPIAEKLIGFGVVGLFLFVIPLFVYHRWKDKNVKDYMITKESLEKMRNHKKRN